MFCDNVRVLDLSDFIKHLEKNPKFKFGVKERRRREIRGRFHPINRKNNSDRKDTSRTQPNPNFSILNTTRFDSIRFDSIRFDSIRFVRLKLLF